MTRSGSYVNERLDHLGIVAGVCQEIGLAEYLDRLDTSFHARVSVGTATVAMILNGLGFSNRRLYLVPQFFANKPVETLLGPNLRAEDVNDDCLGRALDWLYAHDPTVLFAGIAAQARQRFGIAARQIHVDTTSFSVSGVYEPAEGDVDANVIAITYGYSRDRREDLKQWMLALATTVEGDLPLFLRPLDGNRSDKATLVETILALAEQLQPDHTGALRYYVADSGLYSTANMTRLNRAGVWWVSRVPETLAEAQEAVRRQEVTWQTSADGHTQWWSQVMKLPQGQERWVMVRTQQAEERATATVLRQVDKAIVAWEKTLWHLGNQTFACEADAQAVVKKMLKTCPAWLQVQVQVVERPQHERRGRPRAEAQPVGYRYQVQTTWVRDDKAIQREVQRKATFIVATNVLDEAILSTPELIATYKEQGSVERGFAFLKDPLFLASSVFLKKPERIMALALVMVLCLLVYRLAEHRLRQQLAATGQTVPDQLRRPTARPTLRWIFQCFEGVELLHIGTGRQTETLVLGVQPLHEQVLSLLGPPYQKIYKRIN
jgi:transposase